MKGRGMTIEAGFRRVRGTWKLSTFLGATYSDPWMFARVQARVLKLRRERREGAARPPPTASARSCWTRQRRSDEIQAQGRRG